MSQPKVSLCMIVRNEEKNLKGCLASVADLVQEVIIVDTGSTDSTAAIAREFGAKVFNFPWIDDFAAARNESVRHASGEWILWLDADDRIDDANRTRLQQIFRDLHQLDPDQNPVVLAACLSRCASPPSTITQSQGRLYPNTGNLQWHGRIHERLDVVRGSAPLRVIPTDLVIHHRGYEDSSRCWKKQLRDLRILEQDYVVNPDDPMTLFYLGRGRVWQNRFADALRFLKQSIRIGRPRKLTMLPHAHALAVDCLMKLKRLDEAIELNRQASSDFPKDVTLLYQRGVLLHDANQLAEAEECFVRLLSVPRPKFTLTGMEPGVQAENAWHMLGHVYRLQGKIPEAAEQFRKAAEACPGSAESWFYFGQLRLALGSRQDAVAALQRLAQCPNSLCQSSTLHALILLADQNLPECKTLIEKAISADPSNVVPWAVLAEILYREGMDYDRCVHVHEKVTAMDPRQHRLRQRLETMKADHARRVALVNPVGTRALPESDSGHFSGLGAASHLAFAC